MREPSIGKREKVTIVWEHDNRVKSLLGTLLMTKNRRERLQPLVTLFLVSITHPQD